MIDIYVTSAKVEELLALPKNSLAKMRSKGVGPAYHVIGKRIRYRIADVETWLKGVRCAPAHPYGGAISCAVSNGTSEDGK
jgi:hypothetical protein